MCQLRAMMAGLSILSACHAPGPSAPRSNDELSARRAETPPQSLPDNFDDNNNAPPSAVANTSFYVSLGQPTHLYANGSMDPEGDTLSYSWSFVFKPGLSKRADEDISIDPSEHAWFMPDVQGLWALRLDVSDGERTSSAYVILLVGPGNAHPMAGIEVSSDRVPLGAPLIIYAGSSYDLEGDPFVIEYRVTPELAGASYALTRHDDPTRCSFVAFDEGSYQLEVRVFDPLRAHEEWEVLDVYAGDLP